MMQLIHHKAMWCNGHKFHIIKLYDKKETSDCGITTVFQVTNVSSRSDKHPEVSENRYYGYFKDIIECDFNSIKIVIFEVKWYMLQMNERDPERTVIENSNGFTMVNTRELELGIEPYVLPSQCKQVFCSEVLCKAGWSYIVRYDPRGRLVKYNAEKEDNVKEEVDADNEQLVVVDVSDEESDQEFDHPNDVEDGVELGDDIDDEYITKNDIDDDANMIGSCNDNDSSSNDTNEEDDNDDIDDDS